jgi:hypothetical protein
VTLRNKIQKLSSAVNELRHNVIQEDTYLETLQQSNMKNYNQLTQQIQILKKVNDYNIILEFHFIIRHTTEWDYEHER